MALDFHEMIDIFRPKAGSIPQMLILGIMAIGLCGCPPLDHKIFIRNLSTDTARLTLLYNAPFDTLTNRTIAVRATDHTIPIKRKSITQLNDSLAAIAHAGQVTLVIPPHSTVYASDILKSTYLFADKSLVIAHKGRSDTMTANYPYKELQGFNRKLDASYNYFYRTVLYYDIQ